MFWATVLLVVLSLEGVLILFRLTDVTRALDRISDRDARATRWYAR